MNAFLFTAAVTQRQVRSAQGTGHEQLNIWGAALSALVYGGTADEAQKRFEEWCHLSPEGPHPLETEIHQIVGAQFIDQLLTESGTEPSDWPAISGQVTEMVLGSALDDFEQGYWVDTNQEVPPEAATVGLERLKEALPEDIRSGLNWSPEKQFFFLVTVLAPPLPPPELRDEVESEPGPGGEASEEAGGDESSPGAVDTLAEIRELCGAALVRARNSAVAAWLWRKYAAGTPLATNDIAVGQVCAMLPLTPN